MKSTIIRLSAALACTAILGVGAASASSHSISNTGPHSNNQIVAANDNHQYSTVNNQTMVNNANYQTARTGDANVSGNTWGGSASTGNAHNWNNTQTQVMNQTASLPVGTWSAPSNVAEISNTGPHSNNRIEISNHGVTTSNTTNVTTVTNYNHQTASTGDANVSGNTWGGNARSGDANNWNNTQSTVINHTEGSNPGWKQLVYTQQHSEYQPTVWHNDPQFSHESYGGYGGYIAPVYHPVTVYRPVYVQRPIYTPVYANNYNCQPRHIVLPPPVKVSCPPRIIVHPPVIVPPVVICPPPIHRGPPCEQHCQKPIKRVVYQPQRACQHQSW